MTSKELELTITNGVENNQQKPLADLLTKSIKEPDLVVGQVETLTNIPSSLRPFLRLNEARFYYPPVVIEALKNLYREYNQAFLPAIQDNQESSTEYQLITPHDQPSIPFVQIDMIGMPNQFLQTVTNYSLPEIEELLRHNIFEIENSIAMYSLLEGLFAYGGQDSNYRTNFRQNLEKLKSRLGLPIILLALTDQKLESIRKTEFGKNGCDSLSDQEIQDYSGFDKLMGQNDFVHYLQANKGICRHALYIRSSYPKFMLQSPELQRYPDILWDRDIRRIIKNYALTPNIDNPPLTRTADKKGTYDPRRSGLINDTKDYMAKMGMGMMISSFEDFQRALQSYSDQGIYDFRLKPWWAHYGSYGHLNYSEGDTYFSATPAEIVDNIKKRGPYIVQPIIPSSFAHLANLPTSNLYRYIDRIFMACPKGEPIFLGGFRNYISEESEDAKHGRVHGAKNAIFAEILSI